MKEGKVVLFPMFIVAALCIVAIIGGLIFSMKSPKTEEKVKDTFFNISQVEQFEEKGFKIDLNGNYTLEAQEEYGVTGDVEVRVKDEKISAISFDAVLIESKDIEVSEAEEKVASFVKAYSEQNGFPIIEEPKIIQFADDETYKECPENLYEALIKGYVLFEYSYKDAEGILWIVQVYSPKDDVLCGSIIKYPDMSGYVDYEPQINLQKEVIE